MILSLMMNLALSIEKPIKVLIIDSGLDINDQRFSLVLCSKENHANFVKDEPIDDLDNHGTHIAGIIYALAQNHNYCIAICKYYKTNTKDGKQFINCLEHAKDIKADIVNISGGGSNFVQKEYNLIKEQTNTKFIVAAGNEKTKLTKDKCNYYPACYNLSNIETVASTDLNGVISEFSNYGYVKHLKPGEMIRSTIPNNKLMYISGTSQAAAVYTGLYLRQLFNEKLLSNKEIYSTIFNFWGNQ